MGLLPPELRGVFDTFEEERTPLADYDISAAIGAVIKSRKDAGEPITPEAQAEAMAFDFCEDYPDERTGWGTYYGPMSVVPCEGGYKEWPSIQAITRATLGYWERRADEAKHPILRARYADLVWDLARAATGGPADVSNAHRAIDSYVEAIKDGLFEHRSVAVKCADRALVLAASLNDTQRIENVRDAILELDATEAPDEHGAGIAFDLLINNKKVQLPERTVREIIDGEERVLAQGVKNAEEENGLPLSVDRSAERLMTYCRSQQRHDEMKRVGALWARAKIAMAKRAGPMLGAAWLQDLHGKLTSFGCPAEAESVAVVLRDLGKQSVGQMVEHKAEVKVSKEDIDTWTDAMLEGKLPDALMRLVGQFLPDPDRIEEDVKELAKTAPLLSFLSISQVDAAGRQTAQIGSVRDDLDGRVIQHMAQNMQFEGPFLRHLFHELVSRYEVDADALLDEIMKSPVFEDDRRQILRRGLEACLAGDHAVAAHLLIPQIEHALRLLAVQTGSSGYRPNRRHGGIQLRLLGDLLVDPGIVQVLGDRVAKYLQVLLTDPRGWNLRNDLSHGILNADQLGWGSTDRIIHVVLLLGSLRMEEGQPPLSNQGR